LRAPGGGAAEHDWRRVLAEIEARGWGLTGPLLSTRECGALIAAYDDERLFRSRVVMAQHNFGRGEYKYFAYPLPTIVERLRHELYARLAPLANRWMAALDAPYRYPSSLPAFLEACARAGQRRPTPLLLRYARGDYNRLHQDLYGDLHFPLQLAVLLDRPQKDFRGGELVLTEQRPRMQSRAHVVPLARGEGVVLAVHQRPVAGTRGYYRVTLRHGVSEVTAGKRHTLGVIFHDAR
jgi:uncharacterized protein